MATKLSVAGRSLRVGPIIMIRTPGTRLSGRGNSMSETTTRSTSSTSPATTASSDAGHPPDPKRWMALLVILIAQLMVVLDGTIVNIAMPRAQLALGIDDANRQWIVTAYTLTFGGLLLLGGRIADYAGRKRMFIIGLAGFALASALGGAAQNSAMLF